MSITREQARDYISVCIDDAQNVRSIDEMPTNARLVGWQAGYEPSFIAVWSNLGITLEDAEAEEIATDFLVKCGWFVGGKALEPEYVI